MAHLTGSARSPVDLMTGDSCSDCDCRCGMRADSMVETVRELQISLNILEFTGNSTATVVAESEIMYGFTYT